MGCVDGRSVDRWHHVLSDDVDDARARLLEIAIRVFRGPGSEDKPMMNIGGSWSTTWK